MTFIAYGDESGTTGNDPCYSIGLLCVPEDKVKQFDEYIIKLKKKRGVVGELKWSKIKSSSGQVNICLDLLNMILRTDCCFHSIIVEKSKYRNWKGKNINKAFYQSYTYLVKATAKQMNETLVVFIDQKSDKYDKHDEVIGIIANNMLSQVGAGKQIESVKMHDSKEHLGLQVVDIITGAVNSAYMQFIRPELTFSKAKEVAFLRLAEMLGWDRLIYDTFPNKDFNIWHFPVENKARPATKLVNFNKYVKEANQADLDEATTKNA